MCLPLHVSLWLCWFCVWMLQSTWTSLHARVCAPWMVTRPARAPYKYCNYYYYYYYYCDDAIWGVHRISLSRGSLGTDMGWYIAKYLWWRVHYGCTLYHTHCVWIWLWMTWYADHGENERGCCCFLVGNPWTFSQQPQGKTPAEVFIYF